MVRAGYGVYYDTSVYQTIAMQMAQQAPLSKSLERAEQRRQSADAGERIQRLPSTTAHTFAIDPNFRLGYAQNWQLTVQRDLPGSLQMTATYLGIKGTRGVQEFLPNTYPTGAVNPCPACPAGFAYMTSNGNSTREAVANSVAPPAAQRLHRNAPVHLLEIHRRRRRAGRAGLRRTRSSEPG